VSDMRELLERHDRVMRLLLEGEPAAGVQRHVAGCPVCGPMAAKLADVERLLLAAPRPRPELLREVIERTAGRSPCRAEERT